MDFSSFILNDDDDDYDYDEEEVHELDPGQVATAADDSADDIPVAAPLDESSLTPEELAAVPMAELFRPDGQGASERRP